MFHPFPVSFPTWKLESNAFNLRLNERDNSKFKHNKVVLRQLLPVKSLEGRKNNFFRDLFKQAHFSPEIERVNGERYFAKDYHNSSK